MPGGSDRADRAIIDWTSCAAESMSRVKSNCRVMFVLPWLFVELIDVTPAMVENCFSRVVARRQIAHRQQPVAHNAEDQDAGDEERRGDRAFDKWFSDIHDSFPSLPRRPRPLPSPRSPLPSRPPLPGSPRPCPLVPLTTRAPGVNRRCPSVTISSPAAKT